MGILDKLKSEYRFYKEGKRIVNQKQLKLKRIIDKSYMNIKALSPDELKFYEENSDETKRYMNSYKKGGKIKKTGLALLHKGEVVVPAKKVKGRTFKQISKAVTKGLKK